MWLFWFLVFSSIIVFSMALASLTSKPVRGVLIGLLVFFIGLIVSVATDIQEMSKKVLVGVSFHPIVAFSYGMQELGRLEDFGVGLTSDSIGSTENPSGYTFRTCLYSLIADVIVWGIVTWYLNRVMRPDYGQAYPPWFPFTASYWCPGRATSYVPDGDASALSEELPLEPVTDTLQRQSESGENIEIRGLTKVFGESRAVDRLNLNMYKGEVTALLGHNGEYELNSYH